MSTTTEAFQLKRNSQKAPKPKGWKLKEHSFSSLWVKYPDGTSIVRYSLDWRGAFSSQRDQQLGIARFQALLTDPAYRNHEIAIVYDIETNTALLIYRQGIKTGGLL